MAEHRSTAEEAADPGTSPERLLELTEKHPQLHRLIVTNPSTPEVARQWILATNRWAQQAYEADAAPSGGDGTQDGSERSAEDIAEAPDDGASPEDADLDQGEPTQLHQVVPDVDPAPQDQPDEAVSAWGEYPEELVWGTSRAAGARAAVAGNAAAEATDAQDSSTPPPAPPVPQAPAAQTSPSQSSPSSSVRLSPKASVVPLGAAEPPAAAHEPTAQQAPTAAHEPQPGYGAAAYGYGSAAASAAPSAPAGPPSGEEDDADDGSRKKAWIACGGCLVLALVLLAVIGLGARALLSPPDEEQYTRDSSTTSAESAPQETTEEPTEEETTEEDPVSPAPDGALEMDELRSPTGNISCRLEEDSASCSVEDRDFSDAGLEDCEDGPFSLTVADEDAGRACGESFLSDSADTLEYDSSAVRGDMACTSRFDGMTCWNTMTGHGFTVNRVSYDTF